MAVSLPKFYRLSNPSGRLRAKKAKAHAKAWGFNYSSKQVKEKLKAQKKNPSTKKRKLSPKQIAIFGTPRQKAALRASRSRKRNNPSKKLKKMSWKNMLGKRPDSRIKILGKKKKRKNIGEIVSISLAGLAGNPGKRRKNTGMARHRKLKNTKAAKAARRSYRRMQARKNPGTHTHRRRSYRSRRRINAGGVRRRRNPLYRLRRINRGRRSNPSFGGMTSGVIGKTVGFIGGLLGARYITQLVLQSNNTGMMGYAGNIVASIGLGWAAGKVTKNKDFGTTVMVGGLASTLLRFISENTSYGSVIQASLSGAGKTGDVGIGMITDSSFFTPQVAQPGSMTKFITPAATRSYVSGQMAQTVAMAKAGSPKSGMGRVRRAIM